MSGKHSFYVRPKNTGKESLNSKCNLRKISSYRKREVGKTGAKLHEPHSSSKMLRKRNRRTKIFIMDQSNIGTKLFRIIPPPNYLRAVEFIIGARHGSTIFLVCPIGAILNRDIS